MPPWSVKKTGRFKNIVGGAEIQRLVGLLSGLADFHFGDGHFTQQGLAEALTEVVVCFPSIWSYLAPDRGAISSSDVASVEFAVHLSCKNRPELPPDIFAFIRDLLVAATDQRGKGFCLSFSATLPARPWPRGKKIRHFTASTV